jgi:hypothetical protein
VTWSGAARVLETGTSLASYTYNYSSWESVDPLYKNFWVAAIITDSTGSTPNMSLSLNNGHSPTRYSSGNATNDLHCGVFAFSEYEAAGSTSITFTKGAGSNMVVFLHRIFTDADVLPGDEAVTNSASANSGASATRLTIKQWTTESGMNGKHFGYLAGGAREADSVVKCYEGLYQDDEYSYDFGGAPGVGGAMGVKGSPQTEWEAYITSSIAAGMSGVSLLIKDDQGLAFERDGVPGDSITEIDGVAAGDIGEVDGVVAMTRMLPSGLWVSNDPRYMKKAA